MLGHPPALRSVEKGRQYTVSPNFKQDCRHDASMTYACVEVKVLATAPHTASEVVVEAVDDLDDAQGNPIGSQKEP